MRDWVMIPPRKRVSRQWWAEKFVLKYRHNFGQESSIHFALKELWV